MSFADVNGIKICYEIHGEGYLVILIHGNDGKKRIVQSYLLKK